MWRSRGGEARLVGGRGASEGTIGKGNHMRCVAVQGCALAVGCVKSRPFSASPDQPPSSPSRDAAIGAKLGCCIRCTAHSIHPPSVRRSVRPSVHSSKHPAVLHRRRPPLIVPSMVLAAPWMRSAGESLGGARAVPPVMVG
ncbi:unnamed protein product [Vitrella brassicaformis CCMP3155]|uniref:Uncharacterized protein n=1 Tax=Vitrella brassicaformis (strain CCMP3155) TaxID=1169540 RepID=A0A0G4FFN7_VITBC|nr:unnamed protein product [Vitrella brassicaformis CCMP3155]|eukprot:CEM11857.1 unnamed protein product [Vitrella brassicaformis CCMP3155]